MAWPKANAALVVLPIALTGACLYTNPAYDDPAGSASATTSGVNSSTQVDPTTTAPTSSGPTSDPSSSSAPTSTATTSTTDGPDTETDPLTTGTTDPIDTTGSTTGTGTGTETGGGPLNFPLCGHDSWTLTEPENLIAANSIHTENDPILSHDGLTLLFASSRPGGVGDVDSWRLTRPSRVDPFENAPTNNMDLGLNTTASEHTVIISEDQLRAYVVTDRLGGEGLADVWHTTRFAIDQPFLPAENLGTPLNTSENEWDIHLSADELRIYLAPTSNGAQGIATATRVDLDSPFSAPQPIVELNDKGMSNWSPHLTPDGLVIIFSSDRDGQEDIWISARPTLVDPFEEPVPLPVVNTQVGGEGEAILRADGCELIFASNRDGGLGALDLYVSEVIPN